MINAKKLALQEVEQHSQTELKRISQFCQKQKNTLRIPLGYAIAKEFKLTTEAGMRLATAYHYYMLEEKY